MTGYVLGLIALLAAPQGAGPPAGANPCVSCHQGLAAPEAAAHGFAEWSASAHGAIVTCDRCHGGDTTVTGQTAAHQGVYPSRDFRSKAYVTRIPATCGSCHQQELGYYIGSRHAGQVTTGRNGPTCVTCHGSMAVRTPSAGDVDAACGSCHAPGGAASAAVVDTARALLGRLRQTDSTRRAADAAAGQIADARRQQRVRADLERARDLVQRARQGWHAFDFAMVQGALRQADSVLALSVRRE